MKHGKLAGFILTILAASFSNILNAQELSATEIVARADQKSRGMTSQGEMTMTIVRPGWERTVSMKSWSKGDDYFLILHYRTCKGQRTGFFKASKGNVELGAIHRTDDKDSAIDDDAVVDGF